LAGKSCNQINTVATFLRFFTLRDDESSQPIEFLARLSFPHSPQPDPQYVVVNASLKTTS